MAIPKGCPIQIKDLQRLVSNPSALSELLALFKDRVLPFDAEAARHCAELAVLARRGFPTPDGYIAAAAASREFIVASRDTSPYQAAGLTVIDPWAEAQQRPQP